MIDRTAPNYTLAAARCCVRRTLRCAVLTLALVFFAVSAAAHDPLEISATLYFRSNQVELVAEMEFRPARILARPEGNESYAEVLEKLAAHAGSCFTLTSGTETLTPSSAEALASVEDHVRLRLLYSRPSGTSFRVEAPFLKELASDGPYGVSLTVLDMVNQKVVGQTVLFADNPTTPLLAVLPAVPTTVAPPGSPPPAQSVQPAASANPASAAESSASNEGRMNYRWFWWTLAGIIAGCTLWWWLRAKRSYDKLQS